MLTIIWKSEVMLWMDNDDGGPPALDPKAKTTINADALWCRLYIIL